MSEWADEHGTPIWLRKVDGEPVWNPALAEAFAELRGALEAIRWVRNGEEP